MADKEKKGFLKNLYNKGKAFYKNKTEEREFNKALQEAFENQTIKLRVVDPTAKVNIPKYVYAYIDFNLSTMFLREKDSLKKGDLLVNDKDSQTYIITEVDTNVKSRNFKLYDVDHPFTGYYVKYKVT